VVNIPCWCSFEPGEALLLRIRKDRVSISERRLVFILVNILNYVVRYQLLVHITSK
jgi:hypothetical protein